MATVREWHEQLIMQQMAALAAGLGGLTNLGPLLATQQQANSELSSLCSRLGDVVTRVDALATAVAMSRPAHQRILLLEQTFQFSVLLLSVLAV